MKLANISRLLKSVPIAVCVFLVSSIVMYFILPKVEDVHRIVKHPERFNGTIGIVGEVYKELTTQGESASFLMLDCGENSGCTAIPVAYKGERPRLGSNIIAYGKINIDRGRHRFVNMFDADTIKHRDNDFKGNMFYLVRKSIREECIRFRVWLYSKCKNCPTIKETLISAHLFPV